MGDETNIHLPVSIRVENGLPNEEDWEETLGKINLHTLEPVTRDEVFTFTGHCSNDRLDSFLTKMDPSTTLVNYVDDLKKGTPLQEGHDISKDPFGRSFDGILEKSMDTGQDVNSVRGSWYILKDLNVNGVNTNDKIRSIRAGILKSMSVGFGGNRLWYRCSSCGKNIFEWECPHIPGLEDENGRMTFSWIVDGHLREVSTVYSGATPGAYIDKARAYVGQGQLSQENIAKLERRYHVRLDNGKRSFYMPNKEGKRLNLLEMLQSALDKNEIEKARVYEVLSSDGMVFRQPDDIAIRNELGEHASVDGVRSLKADALRGRQYVADLIDKAIQARVKAQGDGFKEDSYRNILTKSGDVDFIKDEIESFEKMAAQRFTPGRQTEPEPLDRVEKERETEPKPKRTDDENIFD